MSEGNQMEDFVFGLDIGTRNVVGTVGYQTEDGFHVIAQCVREHQTRAMLDGQIHDIGRVGATIREVKEVLEQQIFVFLLSQLSVYFVELQSLMHSIHPF